MDKLGNFHIGVYENVDAYSTRLRSLLHKWHNHQMHDSFILDSFITRLVHLDSIYQIKIANPTTLEATYSLVKRWDETRNIPNYGQNYIE